MDRDRIVCFDKIYAMYKTAIYRYLWYLTRDRTESDDLFQETWLRVVKNLDQIEDIQKIKSWLYTIATNIYRDHLRKKKVRHSFFQNWKDNQPVANHINQMNSADPVGESERQEAAGAIMQALKNLPDKLRQVFILREMEGFSYDEIGQLLKLPSGTAKSRMHRAIKQIRQELASHFAIPGIHQGELT
ncbi:MAG: RNA polymerase sigma factor [Candidatus Aminicenantes bacterium]|nr:RNA polymerase sigma factor [Candidatus Aminicenantes bacterium]